MNLADIPPGNYLLTKLPVGYRLWGVPALTRAEATLIELTFRRLNAEVDADIESAALEPGDYPVAPEFNP